MNQRVLNIHLLIGKLIDCIKNRSNSLKSKRRLRSIKKTKRVTILYRSLNINGHS